MRIYEYIINFLHRPIFYWNIIDIFLFLIILWAFITVIKEFAKKKGGK